MPNGKPAGIRCLHLDEDNLCRLFGTPERPDYCAGFKAMLEVCGTSREEAMQTLTWLESETLP
jgi:Fe-S-cluster containining protein